MRMINGYEKIVRQLPKDLHGQYIVRISQRYKWESNFEFFNEYVNFTPEGLIEWEYDWWEGQEEVHLIGYVRIEDVGGFTYV